ncbi:hypothetical protein FIBSPDRAFT_902817 [Athelia psychrophila]|uniref:Uncharacterized protein n=1 Tax=Athelia psychrophila TaxID=1759441 RepID=A0A167WRC9_9AGAM|nr:hypothetical protein FIBSPDRAFT_902817 [Fibularhizoctonia sp. CBS 109695]
MRPYGSPIGGQEWCYGFRTDGSTGFLMATPSDTTSVTSGSSIPLMGFYQDTAPQATYSLGLIIILAIDICFQGMNMRMLGFKPAHVLAHCALNLPSLALPPAPHYLPIRQTDPQLSLILPSPLESLSVQIFTPTLTLASTHAGSHWSLQLETEWISDRSPLKSFQWNPVGPSVRVPISARFGSHSRSLHSDSDGGISSSDVIMCRFKFSLSPTKCTEVVGTSRQIWIGPAHDLQPSLSTSHIQQLELPALRSFGTSSPFEPLPIHHYSLLQQ